MSLNLDNDVFLNSYLGHPPQFLEPMQTEYAKITKISSDDDVNNSVKLYVAFQTESGKEIVGNFKESSGKLEQFVEEINMFCYLDSKIKNITDIVGRTVKVSYFGENCSVKKMEINRYHF